MNITTKFELGQKVWHMEKNRAVEHEIFSMNCSVSYKPGEWAPSNLPEVSESLLLGPSAGKTTDRGWVKSECCFPSKAALLESL